REGGAAVSGLHANFIVNSERQASSEDVRRLMERVIEQVHEQTGCQLEPEVVFARDLAFV
ncbi:MAG: UDP-N-acetylenolpyruvoylglucosamine reductase, partial [Planctomycetes bacterium]|nr:UDP-N-acetylenolpyruvoylglucosamine reductase [Planctomycetota bacterium]